MPGSTATQQARHGSDMDATFIDTLPFLGQTRVHNGRALETRPGLAFIETRGGRVRVRRQPLSSSSSQAAAPRLLIGTDGPNVIEHYDALLRALEGRADVVVFEPPGTGASVPARGF